MYINNLGHMTKMAAMPIYGKNPSKIIFSETNRLISRKLGVRHRWLKYSNVYINHDPVMTLTKFMARSTWVACASEFGKLLKCHLKEKANRKLANGQNIEDSEKKKWPKGLSAPALELNTIIFKHVYWYMQLISGERLQDHWSSGLGMQVRCVSVSEHVWVGGGGPRGEWGWPGSYQPGVYAHLKALFLVKYVSSVVKPYICCSSSA